MTRQDIDFRPFDCDNHYYEALDAFTRHVPDKWKYRCVQWCDIGGRKHHLVGGKLSRAVVNPTWDPIAMPGALRDYFRGNPDGRSPFEMLSEREALPAEYMNRDARVTRLDEQGLESVWLFPTLGVLYEELLKHDVPAVKVLFRAFNQWLDEDWGFNYRDKIYAAPYISLCDVDFACEQLEWALERDARLVVMRPAAAFTEHGPVSPADELFDPFWARLNEAGITLVIHAGDSGYSSNGYAGDSFASIFGGAGAKYKPSIKAFSIERAAYDFLLTLSFERLYDRFPNLRIASVENGSGFLEDLFRKLGQTARKSPGWFSEDPGEVFKQHVWINPFWEDDSYEIVDIMGAERVIFGSDWPHIEGMPQPLDYVDEIKDLDAASTRLILRENTLELTSAAS